MSGDFHGSEHTNDHLPLPLAWEANSAFGVVHPYGCKTCRKYMSHFVAASRTPDDHSFHSAVKTRDSLATMRYLEGIQEGRRIQKQSDDRHFNRCCEERDEALALSVQREDEIQFLREELVELRDLLFSMQVMFEDASSSESSDSGSLDALDLQDSIYSWTESAARHSDSGLAFHPTICAVVQEEEGVVGGAEMEKNEQEIDNVRDLSVGDTPVFSSVSQPQSDASDSESDSSSSMSSPSSTDSLLSDSEPEAPPPQVAAEEGPDELEHLKSLIAAAHGPNNSSILKEVKALCCEAHLAPRHERTACQRYLLEHWRSPSPTRTAHRAPDTPPIPEIFVDASHSGIGFIFGRQWLAWKLKDGWRSETRDINWAEMVAVELGIRAMISAGHHSSVLKVWSDSETVVRALTKRTSKKPELKHILDVILGLCDAYSIRLAVDWVWTKSNPADGPSRGVYPSRDLLFEHHPPIPRNLLPFVSAVV